MNTLSSIVAVIALLAPAHDELPQVVAAQTLGNDILLFHVDHSTTLLALADIVVTNPATNSFGFPVGLATSNDNPSLSSTYVDTNGIRHTVKTPCGGWTPAECARGHQRRLAAMTALFPPRPPRIRIGVRP